MRLGIKRLIVGAVAVLAALIGVAIAVQLTTGPNGGLKPYGLKETLPEMVSSFGANARVVEVIVDSSGAYYQVIGADHQLHIRDYAIVESEISAGTEGYNRKTTNFVRAPTAAESRGAVLTLAQLDPGVVDRLYGKVGFPHQGSSATLTGRSWFLQSGAQPEHRFVAAYNGDSVQRTQAAAAPDPEDGERPVADADHASAVVQRVQDDPDRGVRLHHHDLLGVDEARQAEPHRPAPCDLYLTRPGRCEQDRRVSA